MNWYLLTLWFGAVALKTDTVIAETAEKAVKKTPYSWSDFIGPDPLGTVTVNLLTVIPSTKEWCIDSCAVAKSAS